jgi:uncharacterized protein
MGYPQMTLSVCRHRAAGLPALPDAFRATTIDSSTVLVLGKDDEQADEIEQMILDETIDVIVGSRSWS